MHYKNLPSETFSIFLLHMYSKNFFTCKTLWSICVELYRSPNQWIHKIYTRCIREKEKKALKASLCSRGHFMWARITFELPSHLAEKININVCLVILRRIRLELCQNPSLLRRITQLFLLWKSKCFFGILKEFQIWQENGILLTANMKQKFYFDKKNFKTNTSLFLVI